MERDAVHHSTRFAGRMIGRESSIAFGFALIVVETLLLIVTTQAWIFGVVVAFAIVGILVARATGQFLAFNSRYVLGLAVLCLLKLVFAPADIPAEFQFIRSQFAHELARYLICVQLLMLCGRDSLPSRATLFAQLGWGVLIFGCDVRVPEYRVHWVQMTLGAAIILQGLFGMSTRRAVTDSRGAGWVRLTLVTLTLFAGIVCGSAMADGIARHERQLEWLITNYLFPDRERYSSTGFSGRGSLESVTMWQQFESDEVVLQAVCEETPGYVIGRVFDTFEVRGQRSEWSTSEPSCALSQAYPPPPAVKQDDYLAPIFGTPNPESLHWREYEIWSHTRNRMFVPLDSELFAVHAEHVMYTDGSYSAIDRPDEGELHYLAFVPTPSPTVRLSSEQQAACRQAYDGLDPQAALLAERIFAGCTTTSEKCRAVESYLGANYRYSRQVIRPRGADQISDFLLHNRQGHCEYFATAAALLLRLGGVPTRYVSGYVLTEQNPVDGSWIARNSHAHAWTLAYDAELQGWQVVEATPSDGIPETTSPTWWSSRRQAWSLAWKRWMARTHEVGFLPALGDYVSEYWLIPLIALLLAVGLTVVLRRWSFSGERVQSAGSSTPPKLLKVLRWIDRAAGRRGFTRGDSETLRSFAVRVEHQGLGSVAAAYREYASIRYSSNAGEQDLAGLKVIVRQLLST